MTAHVTTPAAALAEQLDPGRNRIAPADEPETGRSVLEQDLVRSFVPIDLKSSVADPDAELPVAR